MTVGKGKTGRFGITAGIALLVMFCWLAPCSGMDAMTLSEMGGTCGKAGLSIGFCYEINVEQAFESMNYGDGDGWGNSTAYAQNAGWLVLIGSGSNTGTLGVTIEAGNIMEISAASTGSCTYTPGAGYAGLAIPPNTGFFTFSMSKTSITLDDPETVNIYLSNGPGVANAGDRVGYIKETGLAINKADMKSTLYIWPH